MKSGGAVLVVIGQIGAGKSTVCRELASMTGGRHLDIVSMRRQAAGAEDAPAIADAIASFASLGPTVFECTGASRDFEEIVEQLRLRGLTSFVVLLDCSTPVAMRRIRGRIAPRWPDSRTWASQMRWTESRLRLVPADLTLSSETAEPARIASAVCQAWEEAELRPVGNTVPREVSFSQMAAFEVCPWSYRLKYVDHTQESVETEQMYLGSRLHEALAWLYGDPQESCDQVELVAWFRDRLGETLPPGWDGGVARRLFEAGRRALIMHHDVVYRNERRTTIEVEKTVRMKLGKRLTFTGRVDRIALDRSGTVEVIDYKTGKRCTSRPRIPDWLQNAAYGAAVLLELDQSSVIARRIALATGEEEIFLLTRKDVRQVTLALRRWTARLAVSGAFDARPGAHCRSCEFDPICTEKRHERQHLTNPVLIAAATSGDAVGARGPIRRSVR